MSNSFITNSSEFATSVFRNRNKGLRAFLAATLALSVSLTSFQSASANTMSLEVDYTPDSSVTATSVSPGAKIDLRATAPVQSAGQTTQEIIQAIGTDLQLSSVGDIIAPAGWTLYYSTDGINWTTTAPTTTSGWKAVTHVKAKGLLISEGTDSNGRQIAATDASAQQPSSGAFPTTTGSTGDGWDVFFDDNGHLFNLWHHNGSGSNQSLDCHFRNGTSCGSSWPFLVRSPTGTFIMHTNEQSTGWFDPVEDEIWFPTVYEANGVRQVGFACIEVGDVTLVNKWCGGSAETAFVSAGASQNIAGTTCVSTTTSNDLYDCTAGLAASGGRLFTWQVATGDLLCIDIRANAGAGGPCAEGGSISFSQFNDVSSTGNRWRAVVGEWDGRIYGSAGRNKFAVCVVAATLQPCTGWSNARSITNLATRFFKLPTASGSVAGFCFTALDTVNTGTGPSCFDQSGIDISSSVPSTFKVAMRATYASTYDAYAQYSPSYGSRLYWGDANWKVGYGKIYCWDFAINTWCKNWTSAGIPDSNYQIMVDPLNPYCIWSNSDDGIIQTYDAYTGKAGNCAVPAPTAVFDAGAEPLRMACDNSSALQGWKSFALTTTFTYSSAVLTIKNSSGATISGWVNVPIANGYVDLETLTVATTGTNPSFSVTFTGRTEFGEVSARITAVGGSPQLCLRPTAALACPAPIYDLSQLAARTTAVVASGTSFDASDSPTVIPSKTLNVQIGATDPALCGTYISGQALDTSQNPISGATVQLLSSTGSPVLYPADYPDLNLRGLPVTTTTDSNGQYTFSNLVFGGYKVAFSDTATMSVITATSVLGGSGTTTETLAGAATLVSNVVTISSTVVGQINAVYSDGTFACDSTLYFMRGKQLWRQSVTSSSTVAVGAALSTAVINAVGMNTLDGFIYGIVTTAGDGLSAGHVVRISNDGSVESQGAVTGVAASTLATVEAGDFDGRGNLVVKALSSSTIYEINISTMTANVKTLSGSIPSGDLAYVNGNFIATATNDVYRIVPTSTSWQVTTFADQYVSNYGGNHSLASSATGVIYSIDPNRQIYSLTNTAGTVVKADWTNTSVNVGSSPVDAAMCHARPLLNKNFATSSAFAGDLVTLSFTIQNAFGAPAFSNASFTDTLPTGVNVATSPQISTTCNPEATITANGNQIAATGISFQRGEASCSITVQVEATAAGTFTNGPGNVSTTGLEPPNFSTLTVAIKAATAYPDSTVNIAGVTQTISPLVNDNPSTGATFSPSTLKICSSGQVPNSCSATSVVVTGVGTYSVNSTTGVISFAPAAGFTGTPTGIGYQVLDSSGVYVSSTYSPKVVSAPTASPNTSSDAYNTPQVIRPLTNDQLDSAAFWNTSTLKLCKTTETPNNCTVTSSLEIAGQGTYTINPNTGEVTFTPLPTFTGTATAIKYQVSDSFGQTVNSTITPTVLSPPRPTASPDTEQVIPGGTATFSPILGSTGLATKSSSVSPNLVSVCLFTPNTTTCDADGVVTIAGEGTYTLNSVSGVVTFVAQSSISDGVKTSITYQVTDLVGATASSTLTPIVPAAPTLTPNSATDGWDINQTVNVLANDSAAQSASLIVSSVKLCAPTDTRPNCTATSLQVAGQGTYTVNANGTITFDPLPTFSGSATAVYYSVTDTNGRTSATTLNLTVTPPPPPTSNPDTEVVVPGGTAIFSPILGLSGLAQPANASAPDLVSVCLIAPVTGTCSPTGVVTIAGQGTYTLDSASGVVTYVAEPGALPGNKIAITYRVTDEAGQVTTNTLTPIIPPPPAMAPDTSSGAWDVTQTYNVLANDSAATGYSLNPSSVKICISGNTSPNCTGTTIEVAGQGTYTVNSNGTITFDPLPTFSGTASPITYSVTDSLGQKSSTTYSPVVAAPNPPTADPDTKSVLANTGATNNSVSFTAILGLNGLADPGTAQLTDICLLVNGTCDPDDEVINADGTYRLNPTTGVVNFTPAVGVTQSSGITYQVIDAAGLTASSTLTPIIPGLPIANQDSSYGEQNKIQILSPLSNDRPGDTTSPLVPSTLYLCSAGQSSPNCTATNVTVAGVGTYVLDRITGLVTFTPETNYNGNPAPLSYQVSDSLGQVASSSLVIAVLAPPAVSANADAGTAAWTSTVTLSFNVLANDSAGTVPAAGTGGYSAVGTAEFNLATLKLCAPGEAAPNCSLSTLTVPGEGTYTVNANGTITFDPITSFTGTVGTSPMYQICNVIGPVWSPSAPPSTCAVAPITPTITPLAPLTLLPDTTSGAVGEAQQISLIANDTVNAGLKTLTICGANEVAPNCTQTQISVPNVGSYQVVGGTITFNPLPGFEGFAPTLSYTVVDEIERIASSTYTPYVVPNLPPTASPEVKTFVPGVAQSFSAIIDGLATKGTKTLSPALTCIVDGASCVSQLVTADGTWTVDSATGEITFLPKANITPGTKPSVTYRVTDQAGKSAQSTLTPVIAPPPAATNDSKTTPINTATTINVLSNDSAGTGESLVPSSVKFCASGQTGTACNLTTLVVAGEGQYTVDNLGWVTFTPETNFFGTASTISYTIKDGLNQLAQAQIAITIVAPAPAATNDSSVGIKNTVQNFNITNNDQAGIGFTISPATAYLCGAGQSGSTCNLSTLTIAGEGTYVLDAAGNITFTPAQDYVGTATSIRYIVLDELGQRTSATISVVVSPTPVPLPVDDSSTGLVNTTQTLSILNNDAATPGYPIVVGNTKLCDLNEIPNSCTSLYVQIVGQGTYQLDPNTGMVTFEPELDYIGTPTSISYVVKDSYGSSASAVIRIVVTPVPPVQNNLSVTPPVEPIPVKPVPVKPPKANPDSKKGNFNKPADLKPFANDKKGDHVLDNSTLAFCVDKCDVSTSDALIWNSTVETEQGIWQFDPASGKVTFTPARDFHGTATLAYSIKDIQGQLAWSTLTVVIDPPVVPVLAETGQDQSSRYLHFALLGTIAGMGLIYQGAKQNKRRQ